MAVSRLSSLPKYQRLHPDSDVGDDSSYDSRQSATPKGTGVEDGQDREDDDDDDGGDGVDDGEKTPVAAHEDWDDRQEEEVV
jgi:hypothetical protein